jgi:hypothetical protein
MKARSSAASASRRRSGIASAAAIRTRKCASRRTARSKSCPACRTLAAAFARRWPRSSPRSLGSSLPTST